MFQIEPERNCTKIRSLITNEHLQIYFAGIRPWGVINFDYVVADDHPALLLNFKR